MCRLSRATVDNDRELGTARPESVPTDASTSSAQCAQPVVSFPSAELPPRWDWRRSRTNEPALGGRAPSGIAGDHFGSDHVGLCLHPVSAADAADSGRGQASGEQLLDEEADREGGGARDRVGDETVGGGHDDGEGRQRVAEARYARPGAAGQEREGQPGSARPDDVRRGRGGVLVGQRGHVAGGQEPQVWWTTMVSMKPCPVRKRGGAATSPGVPEPATSPAPPSPSPSSLAPAWLGLFSAGLALALIFCLGLALMAGSASHHRHNHRIAWNDGRGGGRPMDETQYPDNPRHP
jgi:hypothetical protein